MCISDRNISKSAAEPVDSESVLYLWSTFSLLKLIWILQHRVLGVKPEENPPLSTPPVHSALVNLPLLWAQRHNQRWKWVFCNLRSITKQQSDLMLIHSRRVGGRREKPIWTQQTICMWKLPGHRGGEEDADIWKKARLHLYMMMQRGTGKVLTLTAGGQGGNTDTTPTLTSFLAFFTLY